MVVKNKKCRERDGLIIKVVPCPNYLKELREGAGINKE